jgi:hypothetical protein
LLSISTGISKFILPLPHSHSASTGCDGRPLNTSGPDGLLWRMEPDGSLVIHADLTSLSRGWNEIVVDGRGNAYINGGGLILSPVRSSPPESSRWSALMVRHDRPPMDEEMTWPVRRSHAPKLTSARPTTQNRFLAAPPRMRRAIYAGRRRQSPPMER